ncbi:trypsin-like serine protease [Paraglaciecola aquimarina]|uniref:Trypsin-like serine protease n=1 Tax=Paraglaciecola aquimarina TaxID=1235557 RepID=A0ABU3SW02_9ALTE|nr:trypsin-like serine protease [Paraglaciecola aquimarina]MDU0354176.1 trypsin-like serine protease [Paraglaciecola aquimarina]
MHNPIQQKRALVTLALTTFMALPIASNAADSTTRPSTQANTNIITPRIVGGEIASQQNWPWMTAYVLTSQAVNTSLSVNSALYQTQHFTSGPSGNVSGEIVSCGDGLQPCVNVQKKICLIKRGTNTFAEKALNCETSGGVGAIIYNNVEGLISGTVGTDFSGRIPLVAVTQTEGEQLLDLVGETAEISVSAVSNLRQDATCGASFLGDKWVLTAAHCVDSSNAFLFQMNVGEYDLSDGAENASPIANIYIHPDYDADAINNDIALVELTESINAPAVRLASDTTTREAAIANSTATVAGWGGRTGYVAGEGPTSNYPNILHQVDLTLLSNEQCEREFSNGTITNAMICATSIIEQGSCQGDSGGPLVINTNEGLQQVGIVSFGVGCADPEYSGVYTRVAEFTDWLDALTEGIAIQQLQDFGIVPVNFATSASLKVVNNSGTTTNVNFNIEGDTAFSLDASDCNTLAPSASCQLVVNYNPQTTGDDLAKIIISTNDNIKVSQAKLVGFAVGPANSLSGVAGPSNNNLSWYSGGDKAWVSNATEGVESGNIGDREESILLALINGSGSLNFDWGVSSEVNEEEGEDPFDILQLYIDGQLIEYISGEVDVHTYADENTPLTLGDGFHLITWVYSKDPATAEGEDKGFVQNVTFIADQVVTPPTAPTPTEPTPSQPSSNNASGGATTWLLLVIASVIWVRRKSS